MDNWRRGQAVQGIHHNASLEFPHLFIHALDGSGTLVRIEHRSQDLVCLQVLGKPLEGELHVFSGPGIFEVLKRNPGQLTIDIRGRLGQQIYLPVLERRPPGTVAVPPPSGTDGDRY